MTLPLNPPAPVEPSRAAARRREHRFYTAMAVAAYVVALIGFNSTIRGTIAGTTELTWLVRVHGGLFTGWLFLFIVQTRLVASGRIALHRRLGTAGAGLAVAMIVIGFRTSIVAARHGYDLDRINDPLGFMIFPLGDLLSFAILVSAALWYRKRPMAHKRLMLMATVGALLNAPLAHLISHTPALFAIKAPIILVPLVLLLSASAVYDKLALGKIHPVSLWAAIALFVWGNLRAAVIRPSAAWHAVAGWLVG